MNKLQGKWNYQSFCAFAAIPDASAVRGAPPLRPALLAGLWAPPSVMEFETASDGKITGKAESGPIKFEIVGSITPAMAAITGITMPTPEGVELVVTVSATGTQYNLRGFLLTGSTHIVGTVVAISNDLGGQPAGTSGPFVLYPVTP